MYSFKKAILCTITAFTVLTNLIFIKPDTVKASDSVPSTAQGVVDDMRVGWNLGNALCCYDLQKNNSEEILKFKKQYQAMATYSTKYYSGWDASACPYFSGNVCNLTWKINSLNSSATGTCGVFGLQIINNSLKNSGSDTLTYTISNATFTKASGDIIKLDEFNKTFSSVITNNTTSYATVNLEKISKLATTNDVKGGTLSLTITINDYPISTRTDVNTATSSYYETLWGNPVTTKALIKAVKDKGFNAIRVPITYYDHIFSDGTIDKDWLNRIDEIVNYIIDNNMYCIIDVHHDTGANGWLRADLSDIDKHSASLSSIWSQVADYFKNYDNHLLFEGFNEILNSECKWNYAGDDAYKATNILNQVFVDTVRRSGGNNASRYLIVSTYAASAEVNVMNGFKLPTDSAKDRLIASVHSYVGTNSVDSLFAGIKSSLLSKGIPVIIGEFGKTNNTSVSNLSARIDYVNKYVSTAAANNITCFWWDDGGIFQSPEKVSNYAIINRNTCKWYFEDIANAMVESSKRLNNTDSISCELSDTDYTDIASWQSGYYNRFSGRYNSSSTRICTNDYLSCEPGHSYNISYSGGMAIIINQYDKDYNLISSSKFNKNTTFTTDSKTSYVTLSLHKTSAPYLSDSSILHYIANFNINITNKIQ